MRRTYSTPCVVVGSLLVAGFGFLPWGASGRAERSSYALVSVADRLEVLDGWGAVLVKAWYLAPALAAVVWLATALGRTAVARAVAATLALGGVALAIVVRRSPVLDRPGPCATIVAACVVGLGLLAPLAERGRNNQPLSGSEQ